VNLRGAEWLERAIETAIGEAVEQRIPIQIPDLQEDLNSPVLDFLPVPIRAGAKLFVVGDVRIQSTLFPERL
jgi:hypothetical protein